MFEDFTVDNGDDTVDVFPGSSVSDVEESEPVYPEELLTDSLPTSDPVSDGVSEGSDGSPSSDGSADPQTDYADTSPPSVEGGSVDPSSDTFDVSVLHDDLIVLSSRLSNVEDSLSLLSSYALDEYNESRSNVSVEDVNVVELTLIAIFVVLLFSAVVSLGRGILR